MPVTSSLRWTRAARRGLLAAVSVAGLWLTAAAPAKAEAAARPADAAVPAEILVRLRRTGALGPLLQRYPLRLVAQFGARPIYRLGLIGTADLAATLLALRLEADVLIAERNTLHQSPEARRNNAWAIGTASAYQAQWAPGAMRLGSAQALSRGAGMRVAVLDTGVDAAHPALAGRLLPGVDLVDGDNDPSEVGHPLTHPAFGHGTHVAGLVALVAPAARILPLRVLDAQGSGNAWVLAEALLHAADPDRNPATDDGAHVVNISLGSYERTRLLDTVGRLASCSIPAEVLEPQDDFTDPGYNDDKARCAAWGGAVIVAAAGNDASASIRQYPAAEGVYGLIAVTATRSDGQLAAFANSGNWIRLAAPGEGITSSVPGGLYGTWSGSSMAAPLVSGVAALLRAREPGLSPRAAVRRLTRSGVEICGQKMPRVDAWAALDGAQHQTASCP